MNDHSFRVTSPLEEADLLSNPEDEESLRPAQKFQTIPTLYINVFELLVLVS
jgi:glutaredoxin-related protein